MNMSTLNSTSNSTPLDQIIVGNAYCSTSKYYIGICCNNATSTDADGAYYCILNRPGGVQGCIDAYTAKVGGSQGLACTDDIKYRTGNGVDYGKEINTKLLFIYSVLLLLAYTLVL